MKDFQPQIASVDALARADAVLRAKLEAIVDLVVRMMQGCDTASVALLLDGRSATAAVSDHLALEVDLVQYRTGEGPCLHAVEASGQVVRLDVVDNVSAYRRFAPGALDLGINSVLSVPLHDGGHVIGSLNLYSRTSGAFDESSVEDAIPFAQAAAAAIASAPVLPAARDLVDSVVAVMEDDSVVNQAIGIVMQRRACSAADATGVLDKLASSMQCDRRAAAEAILVDPTLGG